MPALKRQSQADVCKFEASLVYIVPENPELQWDLVSKKKERKKERKQIMSVSQQN